MADSSDEEERRGSRQRRPSFLLVRSQEEEQQIKQQEAERKRRAIEQKKRQAEEARARKAEAATRRAEEIRQNRARLQAAAAADKARKKAEEVERRQLAAAAATAARWERVQAAINNHHVAQHLDSAETVDRDQQRLVNARLRARNQSQRRTTARGKEPIEVGNSRRADRTNRDQLHRAQLPPEEQAALRDQNTYAVRAVRVRAVRLCSLNTNKHISTKRIHYPLCLERYLHDLRRSRSTL